MQKAVIYIKANYSKNVKDLIYIVELLHPVFAAAQKFDCSIIKVYIEKPYKNRDILTSFKRMLNYLSKHPEIETVFISSCEKILLEYEYLVKLFLLEKKVHVVYDANYSTIIKTGNIVENSQIYNFNDLISKYKKKRS